jgi:predicted glycoside hydrolase/deacetylase ChbG (UPF0249 family)
VTGVASTAQGQGIGAAPDLWETQWVKRLVLCADDFGMSAPVDAGILHLARTGRVTAVSCFSEGPAFAGDAAALRASGVEAGLHLDLTEGFGGASPASLGALVVRSFLAALDRSEIQQRLAMQLDAFERQIGRPPDFVDGHRHVHQLPVVRGLLLGELGRRYPSAPPAVRITVPRRGRGAKAALIAALGGRALRRALDRRDLPRNADFAGVYGFDPGAPYRVLVQGWLDSLEDGGLLMCHPGEPGDDLIGAARVRELGYLASPEFEVDCAAARVVRVGFGAMRAADTGSHSAGMIAQ